MQYLRVNCAEKKCCTLALKNANWANKAWNISLKLLLQNCINIWLLKCRPIYLGWLYFYISSHDNLLLKHRENECIHAAKVISILAHNRKPQQGTQSPEIGHSTEFLDIYFVRVSGNFRKQILKHAAPMKTNFTATFGWNIPDFTITCAALKNRCVWTCLYHSNFNFQVTKDHRDHNGIIAREQWLLILCVLMVWSHEPCCGIRSLSSSN